MYLKFQSVAPSIFEDKNRQFDKTVSLSWNLIYCNEEWKTDGMLSYFTSLVGKHSAVLSQWILEGWDEHKQAITAFAILMTLN